MVRALEEDSLGPPPPWTTSSAVDAASVTNSSAANAAVDVGSATFVVLSPCSVSAVLREEHSLRRSKQNERGGTPEGDGAGGTWRVVLLMDAREFGNSTAFLDTVARRINRRFGGTYAETETLPSADYMFVARRLAADGTGEVLDERVLDLVIERKSVEDLASCLIAKSKGESRLVAVWRCRRLRSQTAARGSTSCLFGQSAAPSPSSMPRCTNFRATAFPKRSSCKLR